MQNEFITSNGAIVTITRGDSFEATVFINQGTLLVPVRYELTGTDNLFLGIMEPNQLFENAIVRKVFTSESKKTEDGDVVISLEPYETEHLHPGTYYYSIKLQQFDDEDDSKEYVTTIVPKTLLYIV